MAKTDNPKPTLQQSMGTTMASLHKLGSKVSPHLGFIYLTVVLLYITLAVYVVSQTMQSTNIGQGTITSQKANEYVISFDKAVILKIDSLSSNTGTSPNIALPSGRINPFSESNY